MTILFNPDSSTDVTNVLEQLKILMQNVQTLPSPPPKADKVYVVPMEKPELDDGIFPTVIVSQFVRNVNEIELGLTINGQRTLKSAKLASNTWVAEIDVYLSKTPISDSVLADLELELFYWPKAIAEVIAESRDLRLMTLQVGPEMSYANSTSLTPPTRLKKRGDSFFGLRLIIPFITQIL